MAALAAGNQGKFWEFHAALFKDYKALNNEKIREIAELLALDMAQFEADLKSPASRKLILEDLQEGQEIDVRGTPTLFLNGKKVENRNIRRLPEMINEILTRQKPLAAHPAGDATSAAPEPDSAQPGAVEPGAPQPDAPATKEMP
jgi:predicted DsbA family dithiol-disulfide isomerase